MQKKTKKKKSSNKNLLIIIGVVVVIIVIFALYFSLGNKKENNENQSLSNIQENLSFTKPSETNFLKAKLEWKEPSKITSSSGRYPFCPDGNNKGRIWMDLSIENQDNNIYFTCIDSVFVEDQSKDIDVIQWNMGTSRNKQAWAGNAEELKKRHVIEVCCNSKDKTINFCKNFTLEPYC